MAEFTAADAIKPRWDPTLKDRAIRVFVGLTILLIGVAVMGHVALRFFRLTDNPIALLLVVIGPAATAGVTLTAALVVSAHAVIGAILRKIPGVVFWGGIVSMIVVVWLAALLFGYVERMADAQTPPERLARTAFGGELTLLEIQAHLTGSEANRDVAPALAALALWPLQFQLARDLAGLLAILGFVNILAMFAIWWERKVSGRIQSRLGPMRVGGWHGWAQSLADGIKLIQKEDIIMDGADRPLFRLAPYLAFVPALSAFIALPFGGYWVFRSLDVGLIFILAMLGIEVVGVIMAGWASNNKWSVYGAMREACQMVSYEIPMGLSLLVPVLTVGTLRLSEIGDLQAGGFHTWLAFANPFTFVAALTYFIASLANCKRAPFDLPEAESELVAGFLTEYSGFRWCLFFFAEYAAMFVVSGIATILFFGAWHSPLPESWGAGLLARGVWGKAAYGVLFSGPLWFVAKGFALVYVQMWVRWTLPRIRLDQVMYACVQVLLPMTMLVLLGATLWSLLVPAGGRLAAIVNGLLTLIGAVGVAGFIAIMSYGFMHRRRLVGTLAVDPLPGA
ncbi:MAG: NADH-quinone oxidoreductase subunit NuoH [Phycisphaerae bacterium]|jgi:NADH-quinone oxidoreductase subunit H